MRAGVTAPLSLASSVMAHFEAEAHHFRQRDFGASWQRGLDAPRDAPPGPPGAIAAQVRDLEFTAPRIAPQPQMLPRNLFRGVERQVYPQILAAASDGDLVLRHQERL